VIISVLRPLRASAIFTKKICVPQDVGEKVVACLDPPSALWGVAERVPLTAHGCPSTLDVSAPARSEVDGPMTTIIHTSGKTRDEVRANVVLI
jgi:hypothetical protein